MKVRHSICFGAVAPFLFLLHKNSYTNSYTAGSFCDLDHDVLKDLEQQIKLLSDKIDSFADERNVLLQTISLNRPVGVSYCFSDQSIIPYSFNEYDAFHLLVGQP
jgi:hypothetical protein